MSQPTDVASIRVVADRVLGIVAAGLQPAFAAALVRHTSKDLKPKVTEEEIAAVTGELPAAAAGHPVTELDVVAGGLLAAHRSQASAAKLWSAIPPSAASAMAADPYDQGPSERHDPCAIAGTALDVPKIEVPSGLVSEEFVTAAGVLAVIYQVADRIGAFAAIDRAIQQLDSDELCIDRVGLLNRLSCWEERDNRVKAPERARLVAKILGLRDADLPQGVQPDAVIPGLLDDVLDAINAHCDPGVYRDEPTSMDVVRLRLATRAVQVRLSSLVTGYSVLRIQDLQVQYSRALAILRGLAHFVRRPCRPRDDDVAAHHTPMQAEWISVSALIGTRLPDGSDLFDAVATAKAWQIIFDDWLIDDGDEEADAMTLARSPSRKVCEAAALLRPARTARDH
ncbi:MAG: hypothetical protein ACRDS0_03560 [Pseudonocardiaceae bacterium]